MTDATQMSLDDIAADMRADKEKIVHLERLCRTQLAMIHELERKLAAFKAIARESV